MYLGATPSESLRLVQAGGVPLEEIPSEPPAEPLGAVDRDGWRRYTPASGRLATRVVPQRCAPLSLERQGCFFIPPHQRLPLRGAGSRRLTEGCDRSGVLRKTCRNRSCPNTSPSGRWPATSPQGEACGRLIAAPTHSLFPLPLPSHIPPIPMGFRGVLCAALTRKAPETPDFPGFVHSNQLREVSRIALTSQ